MKLIKLFNFLNKKNQNFALMHCVSIYPTEAKFSELHTIQKLSKRFLVEKLKSDGLLMKIPKIF